MPFPFSLFPFLLFTRRALLFGLTVAATQTLPAQGLGLAVGTLVPQGHLASGAKSGLAAVASVELGGLVRIEGLWANSDLRGAIIRNGDGVPLPESANVSGTVKLIGGIGSIVLHLGHGFLQPYLLGGAGYYNRSGAQDAKDAASDFRHLSLNASKVGVHFGAGLKFNLLGISAFGEARYHTVKFDGEERTNFVPILVGIRL
ncbi:MAG TPA: hypothetical protein VE967_06480 [Gemmatimonadaceae bacterium]|nr:hypothetical protein [Gemmatimonadaceae bacterium]